MGDGDTSSYSAVLASCPYKDIEIKKAECIGHIQKKIGSRGHALLQRLRGKKLCDGKPVAGKGRLTDKALNLLQNYFGLAIRQNLGNIYQMKKAVWAVLFHNSDIKDMSIRHQFCPRTIASWCKWQCDHISGHKPKLSLPLAIKSILVPVFKDLSNEELLKKCLHGLTQNNNEALNAIIWKRCPKHIFVNRNIIEMSVNSAITNFNEGTYGIIDVLKNLGIRIGCFTHIGLINRDKCRIRKYSIKSSLTAKTRQQKLCHQNKGLMIRKLN